MRSCFIIGFKGRGIKSFDRSVVGSKSMVLSMRIVSLLNELYRVVPRYRFPGLNYNFSPLVKFMELEIIITSPRRETIFVLNYDKLIRCKKL